MSPPRARALTGGALLLRGRPPWPLLVSIGLLACVPPRTPVHVEAGRVAGAAATRASALCFAEADGGEGSYAERHDDVVRVCGEAAAAAGLTVNEDAPSCVRVDVAWVVRDERVEHRIPLECAVGSTEPWFEDAYCSSTGRPVARYVKALALRFTDQVAGSVVHEGRATLQSPYPGFGGSTAAILCRALFERYPATTRATVHVPSQELGP